MQNIAERINSLASESSSSELKEIADYAIAKTNTFIRNAYSLKQAAKWLEDGEFRHSIASTIAMEALGDKPLSFDPNPQQREEARASFEWNVYNCLNWLLYAFQTGVASEIDDFKFKNLIEHPFEYYTNALLALKRRAESDLRGNQDVMLTAHHYIDILIGKISS